MEHLYRDDPHDWGFITGYDRVHRTVVMIDGFDFYAGSTHAALKGWSTNFAASSTGRFSGQCLQTNSPSQNGAFHALPAAYSTVVVGMAIRFANSIGANDDFLVLRAGATSVARLSVNATGGTGKMQIRNSGGTVIATGTTNIVVGTWYYVEMKIFINGASGTCELHLNGGAEIASTTGNFGSTNIDGVGLLNNVGGSTIYQYDDLYVVDCSTGSAPNNTFLGDVRVVTIVPTSDGAHTDWTPSTGVNHWANVDDTTDPNDDTDYNSDATAGHLDTYGCSDVDSGATVFGVQLNLYARKDDAATRQIAPVVRQAGTDYVGTTSTLGSSYAFYSQLYDRDPTPAAWTAANVNADEFGVKTIA